MREGVTKAKRPNTRGWTGGTRAPGQHGPGTRPAQGAAVGRLGTRGPKARAPGVAPGGRLGGAGHPGPRWPGTRGVQGVWPSSWLRVRAPRVLMSRYPGCLGTPYLRTSFSFLPSPLSRHAACLHPASPLPPQPLQEAGPPCCKAAGQDLEEEEEIRAPRRWLDRCEVTTS